MDAKGPPRRANKTRASIEHVLVPPVTVPAGQLRPALALAFGLSFNIRLDALFQACDYRLTDTTAAYPP